MTGGSGPFVPETCLLNCDEAADGTDNSTVDPVEECFLGNEECEEEEDGDTTIEPNDNIDDNQNNNNCTVQLTCPQGQVFDSASCVCKTECPTTSGFLHTNAFGENLTQGLNTVANTDNFRDANGAIIATANCDTGKIFKNDQVNVLSLIPQTRDYIRADGSVGQSTYYPIEFSDCDGNQPDNQDYDPNKPCSDCDKANPLINMNDLQNTPSGIANLEHRHGGDYGWTRDRQETINQNSGDNYHQFHSGYDIEAPVGTPIYAAHAGTVDALIDSHPNDVSQWTDTQGNFDYDGYKDWREVQTPPLATNAGGNKIKIGWTENGSYFSHNYEHVQYGTILVNAGDVVTKGQLIGYTGITGNAQTQANGGPHLHFSKYNASGAIDPSNDILANYNDNGHDDDPCDDN